MRSTIAAVGILVVTCVTGLPHPASAQTDIFTYKGMCDASAAVALDAEHFIVAGDESNRLQIYKRGRQGPVGSVGLSDFLGANKESDLEGAAMVGNRIYWISSHGRNSKGKFQEPRHRFFATDVTAGQPPSVIPIGQPYTKLLDDLLAAEQFKPYKLSGAAKLAPEDRDGLNIEGLAATPDGKLLIGFRNPIRKKRALVVLLENPEDLLNGRAAKFGAPIGLKLKQRGIRSMERVGASYLVIAGPTADSGTFALYRWTGPGSDRATRVDGVDFKDLRPEALFAVTPDTVQVLSDDGARIGKKQCKKQDEAKQSFRSMTIKP